MFGMLDYRAHKLYALLFYPITYALRLFAIFVIPFITYVIGMQFGSIRIWQVAVSIAAIIPIEIIWLIALKIISAIIEGVFNFLIDVVPTEGRNQEEAQAVVWGGKMAIYALEFNKPASEWSDEAIENISKIDLFGRLFHKKTSTRLYALRDHYIDNPDLVPNEYRSDIFLAENNLAPSLAEQAIGNKIYRGWVLSYSILLLLLAFHPLGK